MALKIIYRIVAKSSVASVNIIYSPGCLAWGAIARVAVRRRFTIGLI